MRTLCLQRRVSLPNILLFLSWNYLMALFIMREHARSAVAQAVSKMRSCMQRGEALICGEHVSRSATLHQGAYQGAKPLRCPPRMAVGKRGC